MNRKERRKSAKSAGGRAAGQADPADLLRKLREDARAGRLGAVIKTAETLATLSPGDPKPLAIAGAACRQLRRFDRAERFFAAAAEAAPDDHELAMARVETLREAGKPGPALELHAALAERVGSVEMLSGFVRAAWAAEETGRIAAFCDRILALAPQNMEAMAHKGLALHAEGDAAGGDAVIDMDQLLSVRDIASPEGYDSVAAFNAELSAHVAGHPSMAVPDPDHPTYHNPQLQITAELLNSDVKPIAALRRMVAGAIADYRAERSGSNHPFLAAFPDGAPMSGWATLLDGEGTVDPHIHLEGYLATVYYPLLPPEAARTPEDDETLPEGWLEIGRPAGDYPPALHPPTRLIQPKEGRLVLFPGYFFHRTTPFRSAGRRISVAIDVVAKPAAGPPA